MSRSKLIVAVFLAAVLASPWLSRAPASAQTDELAVIVNPKASVRSLSAGELEAIYSLSIQHWQGGETIIAFNYMPMTQLRSSFDRVVLGMDPDQVARFWIDRRVRGQGDAPRKIPTPELMLRVVANLPGSIGYVPRTMVGPGVKVVALVSGGRVYDPGAK